MSEHATGTALTPLPSFPVEKGKREARHASLLLIGIVFVALVGMVAAEFFLSSTGLGQLIMTASQNFDTGAVFAIILVIGLLGVGLMRIGLMIETHFARWRV